MQAGRVSRRELAKQRLRLGREAHQLEAVGGAQVLQAETQRLARLVQLVPIGHRARRIEHEHHILGNGRAGLHGAGRRGQQEEVAAGPIASVAVRQQVEADIMRILRGEEQLEVRVGAGIAGLETDHRVLRAVARDLDGVTRRVQRRDRPAARQIHLDRDCLDRGGRELLRVQRIGVRHEAIVAAQQLRVLELNPLLAQRLNWEDADLEQALPGVLQQGRIARLAHDVLVDLPRLVRVEQFRLDLLAVDVHREPVDLRAARNREQVGALERLVVRVVESLVHLRNRNLVGDLHGQVVIPNLQRRKRVVARPRARRPDDRRIVNNDETIGTGDSTGQAGRAGS